MLHCSTVRQTASDAPFPLVQQLPWLGNGGKEGAGERGRKRGEGRGGGRGKRGEGRGGRGRGEGEGERERKRGEGGGEKEGDLANVLLEHSLIPCTCPPALTTSALILAVTLLKSL